MNKTLYITFGILLIAILIFGIANFIKISNVSPIKMGGTSMYDSTSTFSQGLIVSGVYNMGRISSVSTDAALTAAQFCRANWVIVDPTYAVNEDTTGASISLPPEAALIADCLPTVGSCKEINFESTASVSARTGIALGDADITLEHISSDSGVPYFNLGDVVRLKACATYSQAGVGSAADTASISWTWTRYDK